MVYKNPKLRIYGLQSLHVQPSGFHFFIFVLNSSREADCLISLGTCSHVLGPIFPTVSVPYFTVISFPGTLVSQFIGIDFFSK